MTDAILEAVGRHLPNIPVSVVSQGAEALVLVTDVHPYCANPSVTNPRYIIKYRPSKPYRHPKIDAQITRNRTVGEAKFMSKLTKLGIPAPALISVDPAHGLIWMEYLGEVLPDGAVSSFKNQLWYLEKNKPTECLGTEVERLCRGVGRLIAQLHLNDMIHGDLTSSNILLSKGQPVLIDFGLSSYSGLAEDKAVDLYVLERAILSTHSAFSDSYNAWLLAGYEAEYKAAKGKKVGEIIKKLDDVRLRGRKRSMLG